MLPIKLFCLLLAITPLILAQQDCPSFVQALPSQRNSQVFPYKEYFAHSGTRGKWDLGNKTACELNAKVRYYVIRNIEPAPRHESAGAFHQQETGICVPEYCNTQTLTPELLRSLSQINNFHIYQPHLWDPNATPPRGPLYYALVNIFYGLVGLCIVSTIIQFITKFIADRKNQEATTIQKKDYSFWLFKSFDVVGNLKSLYMTAEECGQSDHLSTFGFVRILAIIWVIALHGIVRNAEMFKAPGVTGPSTHPEIDAFMLKGDLAPGYFFFMAGFLTVYTVACKASKDTGSGIIGFFLDLIHRFFKIYPGVVVAVLFYWVVMPGLVNGPIWGRYIGAAYVCEERWKDKLLLKDNMKPQPFDWCASYTWYIDVDFQCYPVIVFLAYVFIQSKGFRYFAYLLTCVLIYFSAQYGLDTIHEGEKYRYEPYWNWYPIPYARISELLVGALFGFQYYEYAKLKLKSNFVALCEKYSDFRYLIIAAGAYLNYYAISTPWNETGMWSQLEWVYIKRLYISVGIGFFLIPLANDVPSILKVFMNLRIFQILGKLCFGVYLLHWPFQLMANYTTENIPDVYSHEAMMYQIKLNIAYSFAAALVYHLVLEKPLLNIESHFTKRQQKPQAALEEGQNNIQYKVLSETPDQDETMGEDYSVVMDQSSMRIESPISPDNRSVRSARSIRSVQQIDDNMSIAQDIEMGKFDQYEEKDLSRQEKTISHSRSPSSIQTSSR